MQDRAVETEVLGFAVASEEDQGFADRSYLSINQAGIPGQRGRKKGEMLTHDGCRPATGVICIWDLFLDRIGWCFLTYPFHFNALSFRRKKCVVILLVYVLT